MLLLFYSLAPAPNRVWRTSYQRVVHCSKWLIVNSGQIILLCLGAHAQARYTVVCSCVCVCVCVSVCLCVCVDCYSCSRINEVQVRVSIGF